MIIMGIDPGLQKTGWGIIRAEGSALSFIACGAVCSEAKDEMPARITQIYKGLKEIIDLHQPDEIAVEETFVNKNAMSSLKLGHARGAAILAASLASVSVHEYAATLVKKSIVGVGRAEKEQVQIMVKHILPSAKFESADAADALAVALCHSSHIKSYKVVG